MTRQLSSICLFLLASQLAFAEAPPKAQCSGKPHTLHTLSTNKSATCTLVKLYESERFCLTDSSGVDMDGAPFQVSPGQDIKFGMIINRTADFNMEYALTCVSNDGAFAQSPKSIFNVGANGPADPNISIVDLYGAQASWKSTSVGMDYFLKL